MWLFKRTGQSGFSSSTAEEVTEGIDGTGLTAIVTGASTGIGQETARVLALRGVQVVMGARHLVVGKEVEEAIIKEVPNARVEAMELDLSSVASLGKHLMLSKDNIELQFATNHLGHFLLTNLLLETMKKTMEKGSTEGRIINVSSRRHWFSYPEGNHFDKINDQTGYSSLSAYGQSKLANVLHANELARHLKEEGAEITANSLNPGGAATTCHVALHPGVKGISGYYFADCNVAETSSMGSDSGLADKLWDFSLNLVTKAESEQ